MIYCVHCGAANPQEARFCYRCGQPVVATPAALSEPAAPVAASPPAFYPYNRAASPDYLRSSPELVQYHPLAEGIMGFPYDLQARPQEFYSYVDGEERLVFARRAGFWKRFLAALLDLIFLFIPIMVLSYADYAIRRNGDLGVLTISSRDTPNPEATTPLTFVFLGLILAYFFLTGFLGSGQSVGKRVLKLRVMRLDGRKPDWLTAAVRYLAGYLLSSNIIGLGIVVLILFGLGVNTTVGGFFGIFLFGWGFWWAGWDALKQGWHDKLARTLVVDTREYIEGFHFFREPKS